MPGGHRGRDRRPRGHRGHRGAAIRARRRCRRARSSSARPTVRVPPPAAGTGASRFPLATSSWAGGVVRQTCWSKPATIPPIVCPADGRFLAISRGLRVRRPSPIRPGSPIAASVERSRRDAAASGRPRAAPREPTRSARPRAAWAPRRGRTRDALSRPPGRGATLPELPSMAPTPNGTHLDGSWSRWASVLPRAWVSWNSRGSIHIRSPSSSPSTPVWPGSGRSCWQ